MFHIQVGSVIPVIYDGGFATRDAACNHLKRFGWKLISLNHNTWGIRVDGKLFQAHVVKSPDRQFASSLPRI